ncbi:MAG: glycine--tRNA ligase subunit beta [Rickettsiales bacterium]|nr:glycine--tRNA ligase subunit beta [Rickettsiales bacterium]
MKFGLINNRNKTMELVFEIFSEEIPARMQATARKHLAESSQKIFKANDINFESLNSFVTPRRLTLIADGLDFSKALADKFIYKKGPNCNASSKELDEFKASFHEQDFEIITKEIKNEKYFFAKLSKPKESPEILIKRILERIMAEFPWSKSMRWDESSVKWVRPIRNLLCVLNGKIIPVQYGKIIANTISYGHRFLAPKSFIVNSIKEYFSHLKNGKVILDSEERKTKIKEGITDKINKLDLTLVEDESLLEEVAGLVEYPFVLLGEIDKEFLTLPEEIITITLKTHQKYFTLRNKNGKLAPYFIIVANIETSKNSQQIIAGNQKVLCARLADSQFFFNEDTKTTLESKVTKLKNIIFHEKLGTVFAKVCYMEKFIKHISDLSQIKFDIALAKRAAHLSKTDLTTNLVKELPELQGIIGKYYAELDGENKIVSQAIADHYLPKGKEEKLPSTIEGGIVAIADKIITLVGLFSAGEIPTSSKDPYALRRQALGIIKLICHFKINLNTLELINNALSLLVKKNTTEISGVVTKFLFNRFKFFLKDHFKSDLIESVLSTSTDSFYSDFYKLECLTEFANSKQGHTTFLNIKRVSNILTQTDKIPSILNQKLFNDQEELLYAALIKTQTKIKPMLAQNNYDLVLKTFAEFAKEIDVFFDKILVMDKDPKIRINRLALLKKLEECFLTFADFSCIEI